MSTQLVQLDYMSKNLLNKILEKLPNEKYISHKPVEAVDSLSGFMSAIYSFNLQTENRTDQRKIDRTFVIKFMKGDESFRKFGRAYTQFANEIFIYKTLIPYYERVVEQSPRCTIDVLKWTPTCYCADYGTIEGLSCGSPESFLVLENIKPLGFRSGPRLHLDRQHLLLMTKTIAEYHSFTYALRIQGDVHLENLIGGIIPFPFTTEQGPNLYKAVYEPSFERILQYYDRVRSRLDDKHFVDNVDKFELKYGNKPLECLERFREVDEIFSVILHGDFNRNNCLFKYDHEEGFDNPREVKMFDFQELRYGSPAIDLSFFMYFNMDPAIRDEFWMELLKTYHETLINSICNILGFENPSEHESLRIYSFDNFYEHFSKFAFYGVLVCIHFIPWMACSQSECAMISELFEKDMFSKEFKKAVHTIGGDAASEIILQIMHHASRQGYMDIIFD